MNLSKLSISKIDILSEKETSKVLGGCGSKFKRRRRKRRSHSSCSSSSSSSICAPVIVIGGGV